MRVERMTLRRWAAVEALRERVGNGVCGELASLRFQWLRPVSMASGASPLPALLDAAAWIADSAVAKLHVVPGKRGCDSFALAELANEVIAEFEINESLPDGFRATYFVRGNFSGGHAGNQPPAGYFNTDGALLADASGCRLIQLDNTLWEPFEDEMALARARAEFYHEPELAAEYIQMVEGAVSCR